jgi:hypothetical protein
MSSGAMRCAMVLVAAACQARQAAAPPKELPVVEPALAARALAAVPIALATARPADLVDERGPYPVAFKVVSGPEVTGARLVYDVTRDAAHQPGEVAMRRAGARWEAELPGQPAGSEIAYHFALVLAGRSAQRWPASEPARYRVRVAALRVVGATLEPGRAGQGGELRVSVAAAAPPTGELRARVRGPGGARELRSAADPPVVEPGAAARTLRFALPPLAPGDAADLDVTLGAGDASVHLPGDARQVATVKRAVRAVSPLAAVAAPVSDVRSAGGERWIAFDGGGVVRDGAAGAVRWRGAIDGLRSGVVRFVLPDPNGDAIVATDRGVAVLYPPAAGAQRGLAVAVAAGGSAARAGAAARSALDGSAWLELDPPAAESTGAARWLDVRDGQAAAWSPPDPRLVTITSLDFDEALGCYALGALLAVQGRPAPAVGWRCGAAFAVLPLAPARLGAFAIEPQRVLALARDPADGAPVAAIRYAVSDGRGRGVGFGVFRLRADGAAAALVPIASEATALGAPITALAADPAHRRLLVATDGRGLVALERDEAAAVTAVTQVRGAPSSITAVAMPPGDELIVGGRTGAWRIDGAGAAAPVASEPSAIAGDAIPMDVCGDRVLLGSYAAGPVEIARGAASWQVSRRLASEPALPPGPYGDAVYGRAGEIYVAAAGRGIARIAPDGTGRLLAAVAGLRRRDILRLLARSNGELWVLEAPLPFAGGDTMISVLRDGRVQRSVALGDRDLATVSRWLDTGRGTVLAATRAGLAELGGEPFVRLVSPHAAHGVAVSGGGIVAAVGDTVERWDGARLSPVLFGLDRAPETAGPRSVLDVAIDRGGTWLVLFSGGVIAVLDRQGRVAGMLDAADGVPTTARRLLLHAASGDIVVGSGGEGLIVIGAG